MQIKPAPVSYYRKLHIDDTEHPVARERLRLLNKVDELCRSEGLAVRAALVALELPKSTYYDWRRRPYCGKRRLWYALRHEPGFSLSVSSVGRILQRGVRLGRIQPCAFCQGRTRPRPHRVLEPV